MGKLYLWLYIFVLGFTPIQIFAWDGMPTPPLHIEGRWLKDPTGNNITLHGWMQPIESWFNGEGQQYSNPTDWTNTSNIAGMLNFLKDEATVMSDSSPKYGSTHGWYASFVRVNCDFVGGWTQESGLVNSSQFNGWIQNFVVPYANHLKSRGLYLVLCATGPMMTPNNGSQNAGVVEQQRLRTFWSTVANAPGVKNADNIMFELMNEPVQIESSPGNGNWGSGSGTFFQAFRNWIQPIIDDIRNTGANNVIWVPCLGWQGEPHGWAQYPFTGSNIGVAAHYYPAYGGVYNNSTAVQNLWNSNYKPAADLWPMIITECYWFPGGTGYDDLFNGTTVGFGNALKNAIDSQGNVSFLVGFIADHLYNLVTTDPPYCTLGAREGTQAYFDWLPTYTLAAPDDGSPKFEYASVTDNNPRQINVTLSRSIVDSNYFNGFTVKIDNQVVVIDSVVLSTETNQLLIYLNESVLKDNEITFSYNGGNVVSIYEKSLIGFNDVLVDNLLKGASPRIIELTTSEDGDTLIAKFNIKMKLPSDISALVLIAGYNGNMNIPVLQCYFLNNDSTSLLFSLANKVYGDYELLLSYSGNNIISSDNGLLKTFSDVPVTNYSQGLPMHIDAGKIGTDGKSGMLEFSKSLNTAVIEQSTFTLEANKISVPFNELYSFKNTILFTLQNTLHYGDTITVSYTPGDVAASDKGALEGFSDFQLTNLIIEPKWISIPTVIEAENYYSQSGINTENTSDIGGGLNVGWIDNGDWLEYVIENKTTDTSYEIVFRIAAPSADGKFDFYLDNVKTGQVTVPNTGGWQSWQSVVKNITIDHGKHYLKIVATNGGFNINYLDIKKLVTGIGEVTDDIINIYPNPASKEIIVSSADFQYNKVEIIDIMGKTVFSCLAAHEPELHIPLNLPNGMYIVKIGNGEQFQLKRIIIENN